MNRVANALGIDCGSKNLKLLAVQSQNGQLELTAAGSHELPADILDANSNREHKGFIKHFSKYVADQGLVGRPVVFSIPSSQAVLRWLQLPNADPDELREAARFRVKRHLPFPVEDAYVEASTPVLNGKDNMGDSLVIAVPKSVVIGRAEMLGECGLVPIRAELEAQAILRVIERRLNSLDVMWRDASLTIIDVGGSNTHMYVVQSQRLQFIRGVKFGTNLLAATISDALQISTDEAEALLGSARSTLDSAGILSVEFEEGITKVNLAEPLEKLVREFTRLLRYFRSLHPERSYAGILDHLILCGGVSGLQGFPEFLSKRLSLRVELARPIAGTIAKVNAETFQSISNRQEAFTVVMGLALSGLSSHRESLTGGVKREFFWTRAA